MEQVNVTLTETIKVLLDDKKFSTLRDILITMKPFDIAAVFENLQDEFMNRLDEEAASIEIKDIDNYCVKLEEKRNEILELLYKQSIK